MLAAVSCGHPGDVRWGRLLDAVFVFPRHVRYQCNKGYRMIGDANLYCQSDGTWNKAKPECQIVDCGPLDDIADGAVRLFGTEYGSKAEFTCNEGFKLTGTSTRTCDADGQWSDESPRCEEPCRDLYVKGGQPELLEVAHNEVVNFTCKQHYQLQRAHSLPDPVCRFGKVQGTLPSCEPALAQSGIKRTRRQVQTKIDNLTQRYRKESRERTTGSSPSPWPFFSEVHRILGALPANDRSLIQESPCSPDETVEMIISSMERSNGNTSGEEEVADASDSQGPASTTQQRRPQKRKRQSATENFRNNLLEQQNKLIATLQEATKVDQALRERQVNAQEKLVDLLSQYFNK
ncbi:hypothetical protein HPB49_009671 [Dermacentor silvarum]|uniref:Uncharacterized protein n=1 Tax=Dermacentor silvarum TaxID=543639 RepID=A0ACB8DYI5_DERSI|nr:hypothetical protein HPB49_009671 [Dermacentor silvarum]